MRGRGGVARVGRFPSSDLSPPLTRRRQITFPPRGRRGLSKRKGDPPLSPPLKPSALRGALLSLIPPALRASPLKTSVKGGMERTTPSVTS